jgi:RNase P/RNase MRP subunit p29
VSPINDDTAVLQPVEDIDMDDDAEEIEPRDDSLAAELAKAAPKRWWNRVTIILGAAVLLVGGFIGGAQAQKTWGTPAIPAGAGAGFANGARAGGGTGGFTRGGATAAPTAAPGASGTVKLVDGNTIYVQTADGTTVVVKTDAKTTVRTAAKSTIKRVKAGDTVTVAGAAAADGTVSATSVTADSK